MPAPARIAAFRALVSAVCRGNIKSYLVLPVYLYANYTDHDRIPAAGDADAVRDRPEG
jgi:hypothetical protein